MRISITYTNYPLSPELTQKSKRVATFTQWYYGLGLAGILGVILAVLFPSLTAPAALAMGAGMIGFPILLAWYRKKKFAEYDAEYQKILQARGQQRR